MESNWIYNIGYIQSIWNNGRVCSRAVASSEDTVIPGFNKIIEERIRKAQKDGQFDDLPGKGQPLDLEELNGVREELRLAYKILKNADCKPPELEIKEEIRQTEDLLRGMHDTKKKLRLIKKLNFLIMKLNTMRQGSAEFEMPQVYESKLIDRLGKGNSGDGDT